MKSKIRYGSWLVVATLLGCQSGDDCDRSGCAAMTLRQADSAGKSVIAGVVASETDYVINDCRECTFASANVEAWARSEEVTTEEQLANVIEASPIDATVAGDDGRYLLELDPGDYVLCFGSSSCFSASVVAERTTTLNVKLIDGISSGYLALPGASDFTRSSALQKP
jgi:hypothetical protein